MEASVLDEVLDCLSCARESLNLVKYHKRFAPDKTQFQGPTPLVDLE